MKARVITGLRVEIDPPSHATRWARDQEHAAEKLEDWSREFEEFVRDHRSQDPVSIRVVRDYQDQCSHCGREWEEDKDGPLCCRKAQDEWDAAFEKESA